MFFFCRCGQTASYESLQNVACGNVDEHSWSGVVMKSSCSSHGHQSTKNECQTVQRLNMTLRKEVPVFDSKQNITYRSIACARCNNESIFSFWGLDISCEYTNGSIATPVNITAVKKFLKEHTDCSWNYAPMQNRKQQYKHCVLHDTRCVSNQLPVMSVVKELCHSYSMVFSVDVHWLVKLLNRNPHCALCNPDGKSKKVSTVKLSGLAPLSILLDVSSNISDREEQLPLIPALATQNPIRILVYITFVGTSLSIVSLCFLLGVYFSFKELRNMPGKCLINLSLALLCYQAIFLGVEKSTEVEPLCKAVAILLHFFILAAFSWMSIMAFDTTKTFTVKGKFTT